jgi:hypothetical protein
MCNQVRGFHHSHRVWKFIANRRMTFPNCADINSCLHSYLFPSQTELKVIRHLFDFIIHNVRLKLKVIEHFVRWFSDRCFRPANAALICSLVFERDIEKVYQWWTLGGGGGGGQGNHPLKISSTSHNSCSLVTVGNDLSLNSHSCSTVALRHILALYHY